MSPRALALLGVLVLTPLSEGQPASRGRLDAPGIPLPEGAIARLGNPRLVVLNDGYVNAVALSPDGKLIASGGLRISIWDPASARVLREMKEPERIFVKALAWSRNGRLLASMNADSRFKVWDVATGAPHWAEYHTPQGKNLGVLALKFVAGDRLLAMVTSTTLGLRHRDVGENEPRATAGWRVELWDVEKGTPSSTWTVDEEKRARLKALGDGYEISYVALSPSGDRMAWLATPPRKVKEGKSAVFLYDTATGKLLHTVRNLPRASRVDLPDEGETLLIHPISPAKVEATTSLKGSVVSIPTGQVRFQYDQRFVPPVYQNPWTSFSQGRVFLARSAVRVRDSLLTFDAAGMIRWDWKSGKKQEEYNQSLIAFGVSGNNQRILVGEGRRLRLSDGELSSFQSAADFPFTPSFRFLADGRLLIQAGPEKEGQPRRVSLWDPLKGTVLQSVQIHAWPAAVEERTSLDSWGKLLVYANLRRGEFRAHDLVKDRPVCRLAGYDLASMQKGARAILSGDGSRVLVYSHEPTYTHPDHLAVRWLDAQSGRALGRYDIPYRDMFPSGYHGQTVEWFSEDGSVFGYITPDHRLALVDCARQGVTSIIGIPETERFSHPCWRYESAGYDRFVFARRVRQPPAPVLNARRMNDMSQPEYAVWDRQGHLIRRYRLPSGQGVWGLLSPDARTAVVATDRETIFYETATGRRLGQISLPSKQIQGMAFSPDGKLLATGSRDTTILLWDLARLLRR
jgi:WD domain, G-beta repeat